MRIAGMRLLALTTVALLRSSVVLTNMADEMNKPESKPMFGSPQEVFDAFRAAESREDWHTIYSCFTPKLKNAAVIELLEGSYLFPDTKKVDEVRKKYGVNTSVAMVEYNRRLKEKYGVLPHEQKVRSPDRLLLQEIVLAQLTDKEGFFVEMQKTLFNKEWTPELGDLEQIDIQGDSASARANKTVYTLRGETGDTATKVAEKITARFQFSKENGVWLMDIPPM